MARKTAASLVERASTEDIRRSKTYADYPACLPGYKWLVQEALQNPSKLFANDYCKACGAARRRDEWPEHAREHAQQLGLLKKKAPKDAPAVVSKFDIDSHEKEFPLYSDVRTTIGDTLEEKVDELAFDVSLPELSTALASAIVADVKEASSGDPAICADCAAEN